MKIAVRSGHKSNATSAINVLRTPISELCGADHGNDQLARTGWIANKTNTAKHRLLRILPTAHVGTLEMSLTSQSTVQNIAKLSEIISSCDLVIDTTADSGVFRMAAAEYTQKSKPPIWHLAKPVYWGSGRGDLLPPQRQADLQLNDYRLMLVGSRFECNSRY